MKLRSIWTAGVLGIALATTSLTPAVAQTLTIMKGTANQPLNVPMNRAVVLESDTAFSELSVANPGIADISTLSDKTIYVLGKTPGRTTMTLLTQDGKLISNVEVHVTPDIEEFKERLQQILPGENIEVRTANDGIVMSGTVSSTAKLDRALDLANRYAPDKVSNLMMVAGTQQVMLKVRFAEMQRSVSKSLSSSLGDARRQEQRHRRRDRIAGQRGQHRQRPLWPAAPRARLASASRQGHWNSASCLRRWNPRASCAPWPNRT